MITKFIKKIEIKRPLVFLCGPNSKDETTNRRIILSKYLQENVKKDGVFKALPVIVDNLFDLENISLKNKQLKEFDDNFEIKVTLIEEIISAISYRTYIFLDTMSTGYELGQFVNSNTKNAVKIFVDKEYVDRLYCPIGAYIKESFDIDNREVIYDANYNSRGFIYFKDNKVPDSIINQINLDFENYSNDLSIDYLPLGSKLMQSGDIGYEIKDNKIYFYLDLKTAFYLIAASADYLGISLTKTKNVVRDMFDFKKIKDFFTNNLVFGLFNKTDDYKIIAKDFDVNFRISHYENPNNVLFHIYFLIKSISEIDGGFGYIRKALGKEDYVVENNLCFNDLYFSKLCTLTDLEMEHIRNYNNAPNKYVDEFYCKIHGKKRKLVTYKNNNYGKQLRLIHKKIDFVFRDLFPTSPASCAYKKNHSLLDALNPHLQGIYFSKLDIKEYFDSIKYSFLINEINLYLKEKKGLLVELCKNNKEIIKCCFYKYKLPIGFITSPIISDFYLYRIDKKMQDLSATYTRYADDVLISSEISRQECDEAKEIFIYLIKKYKNLTTNDKCLDKALLNDNDSIKFLGVNIVRKKINENILTVSRSKLVSISKEFCKLTYQERGMLENKQKYCSIFSYIKKINPNSYRKLACLIKVKSGVDITKYKIDHSIHFPMIIKERI